VTGIEKYVGRLSLLFEDEDPDKFKERLELCKSRQQDAEDEIRFFKYVDEQPMHLASTVSEKVGKLIF
jgi:dynein heavy chain, axonemal